jgi:hypothetical protein
LGRQVFFCGIIGKIAIWSGNIPLFLKKNIVGHSHGEGESTRFSLKKYISAGDQVLPFPVFPRTSLQWQYDTR